MTAKKTKKKDSKNKHAKALGQASWEKRKEYQGKEYFRGIAKQRWDRVKFDAR